MLNIQKMLCLSTAHIKPETMALLEEDALEDIVAYPKEIPSTGENCGAFIYVDGASLDEGIEDVPEDLVRVLQYAAKHDASWIMLDDDEEEVEDLPTYYEEWAKVF